MPDLVCLLHASVPPPNSVLVDDCAHAGRAMVIDHHEHHTTPPKYASGRTATERVINALEAGLDPRDFQTVAIRHYDADGVLAVWAMQNPEWAIAEKATLVAAAEFGDFFQSSHEDISDQSSPRAGLRLALAVQEAHALEFDPGWAAKFSRRKALKLRFENGLGEISKALKGETLSIHVDGIVRQIDEELWCRRLISGPVPVLELKSGATLHAVMSLTIEPVVVLACPALASTEGAERWRYSIILRPTYGWGYSEDAVGTVPLRSLAGLKDRLTSLERASERSICRWSEQRFDQTVWRLDCSPRGSRLNPETLARHIADWTALSTARTGLALEPQEAP